MTGSCPASAHVCRETARERDELSRALDNACDRVLALTRERDEALHAYAHRTHDHGWGQLLDVVLRPDGEDLAEYIAMHESNPTEGETDE